MSCFIVVLAGSLVWAISQGVCKERKKNQVVLQANATSLLGNANITLLLFFFFFYRLQFLYGASVGGRVTLMLKAGANLELACPSIVVPSSLFF
uniref:Secreted protein n=1 Tax=Ixodes ricinus TaxID=34613 RepID=A0A147BD16_IXORI